MKTTLFFIFSLITISLCAQEKGVSPLKTQYSEIKTGTTYAVVVGISDYQDEGIPDLRFADKDAEAFANFLRSPAGGSLDGDHLKLLTNDRATAGRIAEALDALIERVKQDDEVIIYFSGHGDVERKTVSQPGFLLAWDAPSRVYMGGGTYSLAFLQEIVTTLSLQNKAKVVVITDACHAGKLAGSQFGGAQLTSANLAKQYANEIKILSCQPDEHSIEGEQWGGGRGAFSYHLLNGLYGMADQNNDQSVNLMEIRRYLEENVSTEVAPQNQMPMVVGNGRDKLSDVYADILSQLKEGRKGQMQLFSATESRGIEEEVLEAADSNIVELYNAFQQAIKDKRFLEPKNTCADYYYEKLSAEPKLERLHSSIRRNYAAALQDDAQQVINLWLKTNSNELSLTNPAKFEKYKDYPLFIEKAAELLGDKHYMYPVLLARKYFFEGFLMFLSNPNRTGDLGDEQFANETLIKYRLALHYQPDFPLVYHWISQVFADNLDQIDSAEYYALRAFELAPAWHLPITKLANQLSSKYWKQFDRARIYLEQATQLDSSSTVIWFYWGVFYIHQEKYSEAERYFNKTIQLDPTFNSAFYNLACVQSLQSNVEKAFESLDHALKLGNYGYYSFIQKDSDFDLLREHTEQWNTLMKKYFPDQHKK